MAKQLRVYTVKEGQLDNFVEFFKRGTAKLRQANGFEVQAWTAPATSQFVWLVEHEGTPEEFTAADQAYYRLPAHAPLHEAALEYLVEGASQNWFVEPLEL